MSIYFIPRNFPLILFASVWAITITLYIFNPYNYNQISNSTYLLLTTSIFSVISGILLAWISTRRKFQIHRNEFGENLREYIFNHTTIFKIVRLSVIMTVIGIGLELIYISDLANGLANYFKNPILARQLYVSSVNNIVKGWDVFHSLANYLIDFNYLASILGAIYFIVAKEKKIYAFMPIILALVISVITFQRYFFVNCFIYWIFTLVTTINLIAPEKQKIYIKKIMRIVTGLILFFFVFSFLLISVRVSFGNAKIKNDVVSNLILKSQYTYVAGNIVGLDHYLNKETGKRYYGGSTLRYIYKWIARLKLIEEYDVIKGNSEFTNVGNDYVNTYTYFRIFHEDFGLLGVVLMGFLWGLTGGLLFYNLENRFSLVKLYLTQIFLFSFFMSFYSFTLIRLPLHLFMVLIIYIVEYKIFKPEQIYTKLN